MRLPATMALGLATLLLALPPRGALALPPGPLAALAMEGHEAAALAEPVRGGYRGGYRVHLRSSLRGGWSRRYGTIRRHPRTPGWLR